MNIVEAIILIVFCPLIWIIVSCITMVHIRLEAKKKWNKNEKLYPYFHYPLYKKIFLLGLKGAINKLVVIATFVGHITMVLFMVFCIWELCANNIYVHYITRVLSGIFLIALLTKLGAYGLSPIKF